MNLVRTISLSGRAADLHGDDSTKLICRVQLFILAVDWILNILADTFLRDPLLLLVLFICQVFLLIVGFIFYMMASANQAMKEGIHEKLLRHHQVTAGLWTLYFSLLIWWYIWSLKRSWPSASDHFSFTLYRDHKTTDFTTIDPPGFDRGDTSINDTLEVFGEFNDRELVNSTSSPNSTGWQNITSSSISSNGSEKRNDHFPLASRSIRRLLRNPEPTFANLTQKKDWDPGNRRANQTSKDNPKFFWSPGFITVYVIERSVSLLFYAANILGTLHILNAHLTDDDKDYNYPAHSEKGSRKHENGRRESNPLSRSKQFMFDSPRKKNMDGIYFESDSNLDDNGDSFVRHLEDQEGDPFENEQYNYTYRYGERPQKDYPTIRSVTETETDEGETSFRSSYGQDLRRDKEGRRRKRVTSKGFNKGKSSTRQKLRSSKDDKSKKSKGSLRNMMMMANLGKSVHLPGQQPWPSLEASLTVGEYGRRDSSPSNFRSNRYPESGDFNSSKTTSASVEMIGTGSTDELLVAQVVNVNEGSFVQGYSNPWVGSEENLQKRGRTDSV